LTVTGEHLAYPTIATFITSFTEDLSNGDPLTHYKALVDPSGPFLDIFKNNLIWLVVGTAGSVGLGLLIAGLVDRVRREALAKTFIFLPLAISLIGASVIWRFVYAWQPGGENQYGLLNAIWTGIGFDPVPWVTTQPINTYLLILIFVWLQTGFAMVVLSAAIKGVSVEILEAARLDGASERQIFFGIIVPIIKGSIITVATTIAIAVLKIFDIVFVMTGGKSGTDVVANNMFLQMFQFSNDGRAAALAVVLFLAVSPIIFINVRNLNRQGIGA
jgi:alpha-glucoside transport system permease protein